MTSARSAWVPAAALLAALLLLLGASLLVGSVRLAPGEVWDALLGGGDARAVTIVRELRLSR